MFKMDNVELLQLASCKVFLSTWKVQLVQNWSSNSTFTHALELTDTQDEMLMIISNTVDFEWSVCTQL